MDNPTYNTDNRPRVLAYYFVIRNSKLNTIRCNWRAYKDRNSAMRQGVVEMLTCCEASPCPFDAIEVRCVNVPEHSFDVRRYCNTEKDRCLYSLGIAYAINHASA